MAQPGEPGTEAVRESEIVGVHGVDAEFLEQLQGGAQPGVGEEGGADVEPPCGVGELLDGAVAAVPGDLTGDPAGEQRGEPAEALRGDEERGPVRPHAAT